MSTSTTEEKSVNDRSANTSAFLRPRTDIYETENGYILEAEMPGVDKGGLQITVDNQELTLVGNRSEPDLSGEEIYREFYPLPYKRVFDLDVSIDTTKISASIEQGVVKLSLPKAENLKPRRIAVTD